MAGWKETEVLEPWVLLSLAATSGSLALNLHYHCETNHWKYLDSNNDQQSCSGWHLTHLMSNFVVSGGVEGCREEGQQRRPPA